MVYDAQSMVITLPPLPGADFSFSAPNCQDSAVHFAVSNPQPGDTYYWDFGDETFNTQPNPGKVFDNISVPPFVTLYVKNIYGCQTTISKQIPITAVQLKGDIKAEPNRTCAGGTLVLTYVPIPGQDMPAIF